MVVQAGFFKRLKVSIGLPWKTGGYTLVATGAVLLFITLTTHFNLKGNFEGVFLLKGKDGHLFELKDDLFLGDGDRLIISFDPEVSDFIRTKIKQHKYGDVYLDYSWRDRDGSGYVRNYLPGGGQLLTCFSRFRDDDGSRPHGLFIGGGLPTSVEGDDVLRLSGTGMAYFDGKRWYHIWCNVNEGLVSGTTMKNVPPSAWRFQGSKVVNEGGNSLAITSSHIAEVDGVPLRIDRYAYFRAGETYLILHFIIRNVGDRPVSYAYCYGDEPWLGEFGSSAGNVGWVKDNIIDYVQWVDSRKYKFAGLFDYGSDAIGEGHDFTMTSDFIEWLGDNVPVVYFSNGPTVFPNDDGRKVPLSGNSRFLGLQWGPKDLGPGQSDSYSLAVGMAVYNTQTGMPVKPEIRLGYTAGAR